jgi:hypothetical protein
MIFEIIGRFFITIIILISTIILIEEYPIIFKIFGFIMGLFYLVGVIYWIWWIL